MILPEHMTTSDRNQRIYETLKGMGLFTEVVLCRDDPTKIDQIIVAAAQPTEVLQVAENSAPAGVVPPIQGPEISDSVRPAKRGGDNVIDFPPVV